jgi:hypothetical protein
MRRIEMPLRDPVAFREEVVVRRDREGDAQELRSLDLCPKFGTILNRPVVIAYVALRSRMGCSIAGWTIRSITSPAMAILIETRSRDTPLRVCSFCADDRRKENHHESYPQQR